MRYTVLYAGGEDEHFDDIYEDIDIISIRPSRIAQSLSEFLL